MNKNFKIREQDYKAMQGMNEKQAGQFIKGLCCYAFEGGRYLQDDEARRLAVAVTGRLGVSLDELRTLSVSARNEVIRALSDGGLSYRQIGRLCGISPSAVGRAVAGQ